MPRTLYPVRRVTQNVRTSTSSVVVGQKETELVVSHIQRIGCQPRKNYFTRWPIPLVVSAEEEKVEVLVAVPAEEYRELHNSGQ